MFTAAAHASNALATLPAHGHGQPATPMDAGRLIETVRHIKRHVHAPEQQIAGLNAALQAFVQDPANRMGLDHRTVSRGLYTRLRLTSFADDFQIVVVLWGPGSGSPIHDHHDTVGAVAALSGCTHETKYHLAPQAGEQVQLLPGETVALCERTVSPILPDEAHQLHAMTNPTDAWAATVHVYLTPVMDFHIYEPQVDGLYRRVGRQLWFDGENAWRQ